jgi:hypothetical protein
MDALWPLAEPLPELVEILRRNRRALRVAERRPAPSERVQRQERPEQSRTAS